MRRRLFRLLRATCSNSPSVFLTDVAEEDVYLSTLTSLASGISFLVFDVISLLIAAAVHLCTSQHHCRVATETTVRKLVAFLLYYISASVIHHYFFF